MTRKKTMLILISALFVFRFAVAQDSLSHNVSIRDTSVSVDDLRIRKGFGFTPVGKSTQIDGFALGLIASAMKSDDSLKIRGLSIELDAFGIIGIPYFFMYAILTPHKWHKSWNTYADSIAHANTSINGFSVGILGSSETGYLKGVGFNGFYCLTQSIKGVVVTAGMNYQYEFNGVQLAGIRNKSTRGKGVQIGLFNSCKSGHLLQIGLINRIGKRITPGINFSSGRKNKSENN